MFTVLAGVLGILAWFGIGPSSGKDDADVADLELRGDGLSDMRLGELRFKQAVSQVADELGPANGNSTTECESGANELVFWEDFYLVGDNGVFVGWVYNPDVRITRPSVRLESESGVTVGTTLAELLAVFGDRIEVYGPTSLSSDLLGEPTYEFAILDAAGRAEDGISGFITGRDRGDVVTTLAAGDGCYFR
ncbi:MAG TPA: hypothetical protein VGR26_14170 [Acidimicrobiales bacterium]|nr:hypothetical protein [Acidimicrobiales bacterium]